MHWSIAVSVSRSRRLAPDSRRGCLKASVKSVFSASTIKLHERRRRVPGWLPRAFIRCLQSDGDSSSSFSPIASLTYRAASFSISPILLPVWRSFSFATMLRRCSFNSAWRCLCSVSDGAVSTRSISLRRATFCVNAGCLAMKWFQSLAPRAAFSEALCRNAPCADRSRSSLG